MKKIILFFLLSFSTLVAQPGSIDSSFPIGQTWKGTLAESYAVAIQPDQKILIAGSFWSYNNNSVNGIIRLNPDGIRDNTFQPGSSFLGSTTEIHHSVLQPDGKIIIVGLFQSFGGIPMSNMARLNTDGSVDTSFNPGLGIANSTSNARIYDMKLLPDGTIMIAGSFETVNGIARKKIARLNSDGSVDMTFNPGVGADADITALTLLADGKILIAGRFMMYNSVLCNHFAKLNADGSLDSSFVSAANLVELNYKLITKICGLPDGKIIVCGYFSMNSGATRNIFRFNADGSVDNSFMVGSGAAGTIGQFVQAGIDDLKIQPDNKIIIAGSFSSYNGASRNKIARLNENGSIDNSFGSNALSSSIFFSIAIQADGRIVVGGNQSLGAARLLGDENLSNESFTRNAISYYPNPVSDVLHLDTPNNITQMKIFNLSGQEVGAQKGFGMHAELLFENLASGIYFTEIATDDGKTTTIKIVKTD